MLLTASFSTFSHHCHLLFWSVNEWKYLHLIHWKTIIIKKRFASAKYQWDTQTKSQNKKDLFLWHLQHSLCYEQSLQTALTWDPPSRECRKSPGPPPGPDAGTHWTSWWLEEEKYEDVILTEHNSERALFSAHRLHTVLMSGMCQDWVSDGLCVCVRLTGEV